MNAVDVSPLSYAVVEAIIAANKSLCRSKRGASIWVDGQVIASAYNTLATGLCDGSEACKATCARRAIHAEQGALLEALCIGPPIDRASMLHVKTVDGALVPSGPPSCVECSKLILAAGIVEMWLYHQDGWVPYPAREFHNLSLINNGLPI